VLPYIHILNRQLQQLPVPVCRLRAGHILNRQLQQLPVPVCRLRAGPHTCSPPLPCVSSPVNVCASAHTYKTDIELIHFAPQISIPAHAYLFVAIEAERRANATTRVEK